MLPMSTKTEWDTVCRRDFCMQWMCVCAYVCLLNAFACFYANWHLLQSAFTNPRCICADLFYNTHRRTHTHKCSYLSGELFRSWEKHRQGFWKGFGNLWIILFESKALKNLENSELWEVFMTDECWQFCFPVQHDSALKWTEVLWAQTTRRPTVKSRISTETEEETKQSFAAAVTSKNIARGRHLFAVSLRGLNRWMRWMHRWLISLYSGAV